MLTEKDKKDDIFNQIQTWVAEYKTTQDRGMKKELKKLITIASMPFVRKLALGFARRATDPVDDLIQAGALGLMKALELYKLNISQSFKTYATYLITGEMKHFLRDKVAVIRPPREVYELSYRINNLLKDIPMDGSEISAEMIAKALSVPEDKIHEVIEVNRRKKVLSLDEIVVKDDDCYVPLIDKIPAEDYQEDIDLYESKIMLHDAINKLDEKLKETICMIYYEDMSQKEVSEKLHISQMQVSRRLKQAFETLHSIITANYNKRLLLEDGIENEEELVLEEEKEEEENYD